MTIITSYTALEIVEGLREPDDEADLIAAYQQLIDDGSAWRLPGRVGRQAARLIEAGVCTLRVVH